MLNFKFRVYRWMLSYLKPYMVHLTFFVFASIVISAIELSIPKFIQYFVDDVLPAGNTSVFGLMLGIVVILFAGSVWLTGHRNRMQRILQEKPSMDLLRTLFDQLRRLGLPYYEKNPTGATLSLFRDELTQLQSVYNRYLPNILHQFIMLVISASLLIHTNARLSLIIIPCFLSYYLLGPYFEKRATIWAREAQERRTAANQHLYNSFAAFLELRAYGMGKWDIGRLVRKFTSMQQANNTQNWHAYLRGTVRRVTTGLGAFVMFGYGIGMVQRGELSVGAFIAFSILYFYVINQLTFLVTLTTEQRILMVQAEKLYDFMQEEAEVREPLAPLQPQSIQGELTFRNVGFAYPNQEAVIRGFNLTVAPGEKVALVGKSGNGKSTVTKLIGRFYDPQEGEILLDGAPLSALSLEALREAVGFVFQENFLFGDTIRENIALGRLDPTDEEIITAAKAAYAHDFIMALPEGYDTRIGERGLKLSGGQKQRIAIARLFLKQPSILVLDEATSALDNVSEYEVKKALDDLMKNCTTLTVAHRLSTVYDYDRIVVVEAGKNAEEGSYDELVIRQGLFYQLLEGERA